jgi:hypothetical protein
LALAKERQILLSCDTRLRRTVTALADMSTFICFFLQLLNIIEILRISSE